MNKPTYDSRFTTHFFIFAFCILHFAFFLPVCQSEENNFDNFRALVWFDHTPNTEDQKEINIISELISGTLLDVTVTVETISGYEKIKTELTRGKVDLIRCDPGSYFALQEQNIPYTIILQQVTDSLIKSASEDSLFTFGEIVVQKDSVIDSTADLSGKTLGILAPESTAGGLYQLFDLKDAGIEPEVVYFDTSDHAVKSLLTGLVDALALPKGRAKDVLYQTPDGQNHLENLKVIHRTRDIPPSIWLIHNRQKDVYAMLLYKALREKFGYEVLLESHKGYYISIPYLLKELSSKNK